MSDDVPVPARSHPTQQEKGQQFNDHQSEVRELHQEISRLNEELDRSHEALNKFKSESKSADKKVYLFGHRVPTSVGIVRIPNALPQDNLYWCVCFCWGRFSCGQIRTERDQWQIKASELEGRGRMLEAEVESLQSKLNRILDEKNMDVEAFHSQEKVLSPCLFSPPVVFRAAWV